jgi:hypothetical protein
MSTYYRQRDGIVKSIGGLSRGGKSAPRAGQMEVSTAVSALSGELYERPGEELQRFPFIWDHSGDTI